MILRAGAVISSLLHSAKQGIALASPSALRRLRINSHAAPCVLAFAPPLFHSLPWRSLSPNLLICLCLYCTWLMWPNACRKNPPVLFCFLGLFFLCSFLGLQLWLIGRPNLALHMMPLSGLWLELKEMKRWNPLASGSRIDLIVHALPTSHPPSLCDRASTRLTETILI